MAAGGVRGLGLGGGRHQARSERLLVAWPSGVGEPGWRCCTFILGFWSGWWRGSNVFSVRGTSEDGMNVQRGRRCTFILVHGPGSSGGSV